MSGRVGLFDVLDADGGGELSVNELHGFVQSADLQLLCGVGSTTIISLQLIINPIAASAEREGDIFINPKEYIPIFPAKTR